MSLDNYGRNRQSITDLHETLTQTFLDQPDVRINEGNLPVIPATSLLHVLTQFSRDQGIVLMTKEEETSLTELLRDNTNLEITPDLLMGFIAQATGPSVQALSPPVPPEDSPGGSSDDSSYDSYSNRPQSRARGSRNSSVESSHTSGHHAEFSTPKTPNSPFELKNRQRSTPLESKAPSSWAKKPPPAYRRRKSDAGSRGLSDTESSPSTAALPRRGSRNRAPSNPTSPTSTNNHPFPNSTSPPSRHASHPSLPNSFDNYLWDQSKIGVGSSPIPNYDNFDDPASLATSVSSLATPNTADSDASDDEGLVHDRSVASSLVSLSDDHDRAEALARINADLNRKIQEQERTLLSRLSQHESELEELQMKLDETKSELTATKREEKELRLKERNNSLQIAGLESEIAKLQRSLENARASYQNLQKQYQEQCQESEKYRNLLRRKDQAMKDAEEINALHLAESDKWARERESLEAQLLSFQQELAIARQAQIDLEGQKQENLLLKETIDRLRFDLDELRASSVAAAAAGGSRGVSHGGTLSRTWGQELKNQLEHLDIDHPQSPAGNDEQLPEEDQEIDGEEVIHTYITHKRKVAGRANKPAPVIHVEENKEYADAYTQHEFADFTLSTETQTDPPPKVLLSSSEVQTDENIGRSFSTQTEPEPQVSRSSIHVQTDLTAIDVLLPSPDIMQATREEDDLASSSSTIRPSTPKPASPARDHPPPYAPVGDRDRDAVTYAQAQERNARHELKVAAATIKKWHEGVKVPFEPVPGGVSTDALEEWEALKKELGMECQVIERVISQSKKTGERRRPTGSGTSEARTLNSGPSPITHLYNLYNRYFGGGDLKPPVDETVELPVEPLSNSVVAQVLFGLGVWFVVVVAVTPYMTTYYSVPGMPTYSDRVFWTAYNALSGVIGEGFTGPPGIGPGVTGFPDGTASEAVWVIAERLLFGAATAVRRPS